MCQRCSTEESSESEASRLCQRLFDVERLQAEDKVLLSYYNRVLSVLQEGPSCGLAALCMAGQLVKLEKCPPYLSLRNILEIAQIRGYSSQGEMFSAANMCQLAQDMLNCPVQLVQDGFKPRKDIILHLLKGHPILVPYDADLNHEPCCRNGHKAHWAVLTGVVVVTSRKLDLSTGFSRDPSLPILFHANTNNDSRADHCHIPLMLESLVGNEDIYLYAKQGKSCHVGLWNYEALASSNSNLVELCPRRRDSPQKFIIPKEGVQGGLCQQLLLIGGCQREQS